MVGRWTSPSFSCPQIGRPVVDCVTPLPLKVTVFGDEEALLTTDTLPVTFPAAAGAKVTFKVALCAGVRICPTEMPLRLKPAPEMLKLEMVTSELPEFVSVIESVLPLPMPTFPNVKLFVLAFKRSFAAGDPAVFSVTPLHAVNENDKKIARMGAKERLYPKACSAALSEAWGCAELGLKSAAT